MAEGAAFETDFAALHEIEDFGDECGVFGIYEPGANVAEAAYEGNFNLKHRGQDASGILVVNDFGEFILHKALGDPASVFKDGDLISDIFPDSGLLAMGHDRYGTQKHLPEDLRAHAAQPMRIEKEAYHFAIEYNGDIPNMRNLLVEHGLDPEICVSDTEGLLYLLEQDMDSQMESPDLKTALRRILPQLDGAFSAIFTDGKELIAARDPQGFRPFVYGKTTTGGHVMASEIHALDAVNAQLIEEIEPGTMMSIGEKGVFKESFASSEKQTPCMYEYLYVSKEDNEFHGKNIGEVRDELGIELAQQQPITGVDFLVGVPNTGIRVIRAYAKALDLPYQQAIIKNPKYKKDLRSFIASSQEEREAITREKILVVEEMVYGKKIAVGDDSIIRGTVKKTIIQMLREAGAQEVHVRIPAPQYDFSCHYGMDTGRQDELLSYGRSHEEMRQYLNADSLAFLGAEDVRRAVGRRVGELCMGCSTGIYPTSVPVQLKAS